MVSELGTTLSRRCRERTARRPRFSTSDTDIFHQFIVNFVSSTMEQASVSPMLLPTLPPYDAGVNKTKPGLKKIPPYWYPYTTMAKGRWLGREILEVVSTEFRDRSMEFYVGLSLSLRICRVSMLHKRSVSKALMYAIQCRTTQYMSTCTSVSCTVPTNRAAAYATLSATVSFYL